MGRKNLKKFLGNLLIVSALTLLGLIYLPILKIYLPANPGVNLNSNFSINIPRINAYAPLVDNVDPWNEDEYRKALKNGVAIAKGFSKPGESGTIYIFAHSSDSPWRISSYNTVFFRLGELKEADLIDITYAGKQYQYRVSYSVEVWPNEAQALTKQTGNQLILQTCTPIGTSLKRLLIFANPI
ncbi:sortase [Candidatus Daviesbacteria bacterium]|nr:sortase [Candidatus Daviesbacteria bacterium]